jgi:precorrin-3B synthase
MTAPAIDRRRGACPGLSAPMPTGDGLLARLMPTGTMPLAAFAELCAAARTHGNGVIEVTARGSIQIRGLTPASAPRFATAIAALRIAADDGIPVTTNPLAGLDAEEIFDTRMLAADLRRSIAETSLSASLTPKVSVAIDGGGALNLDALTADVRLCAEATGSGVLVRVSVAGSAASATELGTVEPAHGVAATMRVLRIIARSGADARARDVLATAGATPFRDALSDLLLIPTGPGSRGDRPTEDAIGMHWLRDRSLACGIGLAFGHADARALENLMEAAGKAGAASVRPAPGRALLIIGLTPQTGLSFAAAAGQLGFIVRADDPRRRVIACAGAPICASAYGAARAMAPLIVATAAPFISSGLTIHVSGCAKGCAHPGKAALTAFGTAAGYALVVNGSAGDRTEMIVQPSELPDALARAARALTAEPGHV